MNCVRFAKILADFHEGKLPLRESADAEQHLERCPSCRMLLQVAFGDVRILPQEMQDGLAEAILKRTSGLVCQRAEASLWEFARGELPAEEAQLINLHLDHCAACQSIAEECAALQEILPGLSQIDPGERWTREVIRATSGRRITRQDPLARFRVWWNRVVQRPRFALEAAYACTVLLFLVFSPSLPFRSIAFDAIPVKMIHPTAQYAASAWSNTKDPLSHQTRKLACIVVSGNQAVTRTLQTGASVFYSALAERLCAAEGWQRKETARAIAFLNRTLKGKAGGGSYPSVP